MMRHAPPILVVLLAIGCGSDGGATGSTDAAIPGRPDAATADAPTAPIDAGPGPGDGGPEVDAAAPIDAAVDATPPIDAAPPLDGGMSLYRGVFTPVVGEGVARSQSHILWLTLPIEPSGTMSGSRTRLDLGPR